MWSRMALQDRWVPATILVMATIEDRILDTLKSCTGPICDDCLAQRAALRRRQQANACCNGLAAWAGFERERSTCSRCGKDDKWTNRLRLVDLHAEPIDVPMHGALAAPARAWFWEGNVQSRLIAWLVERSWRIQSAANTAARTPGKDVIAAGPDGRELWVSVKGYPENSPNVQARHWYAGALFDLVLYRDEGSSARLAIALPDGFKTYQGLAGRTSWLRKTMPFCIFWVSEDGSVRAE